MACDGATDGQLLVGDSEQVAVAANLLSHRSQGVDRSPPLEFVDDDDVSDIEHLNFLELGVGAIFCGHHVESVVNMVGDCIIGLSDAASFSKNEVEAYCLTDFDCLSEVVTYLLAGAAAGETSHVEV